MSARGILGALAILLTSSAGPETVSAQTRRPTIRLDDGLEFPYMRLIRFWESADEKAAGPTPNDRAPGQIMRNPGVYVHGNVSKADAGIVERKLRAVLDVLMAQKSLRDPHGSDIRTSINISRGTNGQVQGSLGITAYPINLADPKTRAINGRYATPGEGPSLNVKYNAPLHDQSWDRVLIVGEVDGIKIQSILVGYAGLIVKSSRQFLTPGQNGMALNPKFFDTSRPVGDLQLMWFYPSSGFGDREDPTTGRGRVAAAGFMADWNEIVRRMEQVR